MQLIGQYHIVSLLMSLLVAWLPHADDPSEETVLFVTPT